jgi:uncharacterized short protein YbdD (DUF466 family)
VIARGWAAVRWYLRALTGEDRYDRHVAACTADGRTPMTRRAFERHRSDLAAAHAHERCC